MHASDSKRTHNIFSLDWCADAFSRAGINFLPTWMGKLSFSFSMTASDIHTRALATLTCTKRSDFSFRKTKLFSFSRHSYLLFLLVQFGSVCLFFPPSLSLIVVTMLHVTVCFGFRWNIGRKSKQDYPKRKCFFLSSFYFGILLLFAQAKRSFYSVFSLTIFVPFSVIVCGSLKKQGIYNRQNPHCVCTCVWVRLMQPDER